MFAIAFDMDINELRQSYGEPYNNAYYEIKILLRNFDFYNTQGSVYLTDKNDMTNLFSAIIALKNTSWFKKSVRVRFYTISKRIINVISNPRRDARDFLLIFVKLTLFEQCIESHLIFDNLFYPLEKFVKSIVATVRTIPCQQEIHVFASIL